MPERSKPEHSKPEQSLRKGSFRELGVAVLKTELAGLQHLMDGLDDNFDLACEHLLNCKGRVVVMGMGKSGHIGGKIAATLASTGTPAFFVHPGEAGHGDLGMITSQDVVLALSYSGETDELVTLLPTIKRLGIPMIALTGRPESSLATSASVHLDVNVPDEACPLGLAPTASSTATLAMGDALAIALLEARGFTEEDFARSHPAGSLGRRLLLHLEDVMHKGDAVPSVGLDASLSATLLEMSRKGLGMSAIVDQNGCIAGVYTDGDLRRTLDKGADVHSSMIRNLMTLAPKTVKRDVLAAEALEIMDRCKINGLLVVDADDRLVGALNMHDLLRAGVV